ncbi:hypothetical protein DV737_g3683, partial [Chaetothyriales sp. CBS 132003]
MPPRLRLRSLAQLADGPATHRRASMCLRCQHYATATALPSTTSTSTSSYHPLQPPSHRDPAYRKSQLLRSYVSLLQTTPLIVIFQHNNLKAQEWVGIRRELERALQRVDQQLAAADPDAQPLSQSIKLQVVKPTIFEVGLRVAEYYKPGQSAPGQDDDASLTHALSEAAYKAVFGLKGAHPLTPLLTGSTALLTVPVVSPQYLKAALSILAPTPGAASAFAAPSRKAVPSYYELNVQDGVKKLLLLGARVDGRVLDMDGTRWVGSIDGGIDGLRAQLVSLLQHAGIGLARTLESAGQSLWFTMESRRRDMEPSEEEKTE